MDTGNPEACEEAVRSLSAAPPDQWGEILSMLGASFHPATGKMQSKEAPFTVSSLLRGLGQQSAPEASHSQLPPQALQPSQQPSNESQKGNAVGSRPRGRRKFKSPIRPAESITEDTRDIEDLLRDLGESSANARTKKKGKAKDVLKTIGVSKGMSEVAVGSVAPSEPRVTNADALSTEGASGNNENCVAHCEVDKGLTMVVPDSSPAELIQKPTLGQTTDKDLSERPDLRFGGTAFQTIVEGRCEASGEVAAVISLEFPLASGKSDNHGEEEAALGPVIVSESSASSSLPYVVASDEALGYDDLETDLEEDEELGATLTMHRSLSEGNLPEVCQSTTRIPPRPSPELLGSADMEGRVPAIPHFCGRPSVGTWLQHPVGPRRVQHDLCEDSSVATSANRRSGGARSCSAELTKPKVDSRSFHARPSVAAWLMARPHTPSPTRSTTTCCRLPTQGGLDTSQKPSISRDRSASKEPLQLWPATPTATPPDSPRFDGGQVVWLPVPVHLLPEVQAVLCRNGVHPLQFASSP